MMQSETDHNRKTRLVLILALLYSVSVLATDAFAAVGVGWPIDWTVFRWWPARDWDAPFLLRFDGFKFLFWFAIPFCCCLPWMDWGALGIRGWKKIDAAILLFILLGGLGAMALIPHVPALAKLYYHPSNLPSDVRNLIAMQHLVWVFSWLLGWEFLHRYFLLRPLRACWPKYGWLAVPLAETLYHLQKPGLEVLGMAAFSLILTPWAIRRKNVLLPFLAHFIIEVELILFMRFYA